MAADPATAAPFPVPMGWFQLAWSHELAPGQVLARHAFGRELVLWRDDEGGAHCHDAFCPHLGAHLGHGGQVHGCVIACPFHGWRFDADGTNTSVPYSSRTNGRATLSTLALVELAGLVLVWHHPGGAPPSFDLPDDELADLLAVVGDPGWTPPRHRRYLVDAPWQEVAENGVDTAHFRYVHHTAELPVLERYSTDAHRASMRSRQAFVTPRGTTWGRIDADSWGPGVGVTRFSGVVDTVLFASNLPLDATHCELRFTFTTSRAGLGDAATGVGDAFVAEVHRQLLQDRPVWEHKAHLVRPALADTDGPVMRFRSWAAQFYDPPLDPGRPGVFPPAPHRDGTGPPRPRGDDGDGDQGAPAAHRLGDDPFTSPASTRPPS